MHFAIWSGAATGIRMPLWSRSARHLIDVHAKGWRTALLDMPNPSGAGWEEPITQLEVNCHGKPGKLFLPTESGPGLVDHTSVDEFAGMIRPSLAAGALIELLACQVAAHSGVRTKEERQGNRSRTIGPSGAAVPCTYSESVLTEYWGAYERDRHRRRAGTVYTLEGEELEDSLEYIAVAKRYDWGREDNGLYFCQRLAAMSGGIVRAADLRQDEEDDSSIRATDVAGNWEGHVWDFYPDGHVTYLGWNLPRTQAPISLSPAEPHRRPMGLTASATPLRPQRFNRAPLPA